MCCCRLHHISTYRLLIFISDTHYKIYELRFGVHYLTSLFNFGEQIVLMYPLFMQAVRFFWFAVVTLPTASTYVTLYVNILLLFDVYSCMWQDVEKILVCSFVYIYMCVCFKKNTNVVRKIFAWQFRDIEELDQWRSFITLDMVHKHLNNELMVKCRSFMCQVSHEIKKLVSFHTCPSSLWMLLCTSFVIELL